jgi:hypothetical protein
MIPLCCTEVFDRNKAVESTHWLARRNLAIRLSRIALLARAFKYTATGQSKSIVSLYVYWSSTGPSPKYIQLLKLYTKRKESQELER